MNSRMRCPDRDTTNWMHGGVTSLNLLLNKSLMTSRVLNVQNVNDEIYHALVHQNPERTEWHSCKKSNFPFHPHIIVLLFLIWFNYIHRQKEEKQRNRFIVGFEKLISSVRRMIDSQRLRYSIEIPRQEEVSNSFIHDVGWKRWSKDWTTVVCQIIASSSFDRNK